MADWGYGKSNGPDTWSKKFPEARGLHQSPVDISPVDVKKLETSKPLTWKYGPLEHAELINPGYCWKVHVEGNAGSVTGGPLESVYVLEQFHCHWGETDDEGSEHTVDGKPFSGELHFVHWNTKYKNFEEALKYPDGLCVLGVFLKAGKPHAELQKIVAGLPSVRNKYQQQVIKEKLNPSLFFPKNNSYFTYQGSLTTPPCSECVIWIVFKEPIEVSSKQLEAFRELSSACDEACNPTAKIINNARPPLPLGERIINECQG